MDPTLGLERTVAAAPPEHQERVVGTAAELAQRLKRLTVAAMRSRREQENIRSVSAYRGRGCEALASLTQLMRFVDHDDVPPALRDGRQDLRPFHEVHRRNDD